MIRFFFYNVYYPRDIPFVFNCTKYKLKARDQKKRNDGSTHKKSIIRLQLKHELITNRGGIKRNAFLRVTIGKRFLFKTNKFTKFC